MWPPADRFILKLFRRLEPGINPDLEIGRFLTDRAAFPHVPAVTGAIDESSSKMFRPPISPPWIMWSQPLKNATASVLSSPCVSEMSPTRSI